MMSWLVAAIAMDVAAQAQAHYARYGSVRRPRNTPEALGIRMKFFETTWLDNPNAHAVICASLAGLLFLAIYLGVKA